MSSTFIEDVKKLEIDMTKDTWATRWEPRSKLVTCLLCAFLVVAFQSPIFLSAIFISVLLLVLSMGFPFKVILSKLVLLVPFLLLMSIPILFSGGIPIEETRIIFVLNLNLKTLTAALLIIMMMLTQPIPQFLNGLSHLHLPDSMIAILTLALHFTRLLYRTLLLYQKALVSRLFRPSSGLKSMHVLSGVMAGLVLKSFDQSDKVYQAMAARGFSGKIPTSQPKPITKNDVIKSLALFLFVLLLFLLEKWWTL